jgi:hypothetical protein
MKSFVSQSGMNIHFSRPISATKLLQRVALAIVVVPTLNASSAHAITFNFNYAPNTSPEVINGFNEAANLWSTLLTDDVVINLNVQFTTIPSGSLGRFDPSRVNVTYEEFTAALWSDITSPDDAIASANLPQGSRFDMLVGSEFDLLINGTRNHPVSEGNLDAYLDNDGDCNNRSVRLTTANAKALGLPTSSTTNCAPNNAGIQNTNDGSIILNSNFQWDFDATDGIALNAYDFTGIAAQGIGTALGFVSGVDVLDFNSPLIQSNGKPAYFKDEQFAYVSPLDLFRVSSDSCDLSLQGTDSVTGRRRNLIDWTTGRSDDTGAEVKKFFSIDGCESLIAEFSTGVSKGDGNRAGSWKADEDANEYLGIMEPTPVPGQLFQFTGNDQRAFDVIGWDLANPNLPPPIRNIEIDDGNGNNDNGGDNGEDNGGSPGDSNGENPPVSVPEPSLASGLIGLGFTGTTLAIARRKKHTRN